MKDEHNDLLSELFNLLKLIFLAVYLITGTTLFYQLGGTGGFLTIIYGFGLSVVSLAYIHMGILFPLSILLSERRAGFLSTLFFVPLPLVLSLLILFTDASAKLFYLPAGIVLVDLLLIVAVTLRAKMMNTAKQPVTQ